VLKPGQKIGKYKLKSRLANGPYATVFRALDTLEGVHVALKIPHKGLVTKESLDDFSREVRLAAKLEYPAPQIGGFHRWSFGNRVAPGR
jgi:eukaryotic-like serine/threonine-protein kinase